MSTAIIPKSEMRRCRNISVGLGEVPAVIVEGVQGWGLPGGGVTFSEEKALEAAIELDREIRLRLKSINQLLTVN